LTLPVLDNVLVHANPDQHLLVDVPPIQVILVNTICSLHPHYPRCMPMNSHKSPLVHVKYEDFLKWDTQVIPVIRPFEDRNPWVWRFSISRTPQKSWPMSWGPVRCIGLGRTLRCHMPVLCHNSGVLGVQRSVGIPGS
jgi:hypothetical protein